VRSWSFKGKSNAEAREKGKCRSKWELHTKGKGWEYVVLSAGKKQTWNTKTGIRGPIKKARACDDCNQELEERGPGGE